MAIAAADNSYRDTFIFACFPSTILNNCDVVVGRGTSLLFIIPYRHSFLQGFGGMETILDEGRAGQVLFSGWYACRSQ